MIKNYWIPQELRYKAILPCGVCGYNTIHEEDVRGSWTCTLCHHQCWFESRMPADVSARIPRNRRYEIIGGVAVPKPRLPGFDNPARRGP